MNRRCIGPPRGGFTYIELIAAMVSATVLIVALGATVAVSTKLLEIPRANQQQLHDWQIADRLASDMRYATRIDDIDAHRFDITKPDLSNGSPETAVYDLTANELVRQVGNQPAAILDPEAPRYGFSVDGYLAPTDMPSALIPRVRSTSRATTSSLTNSLNIGPPRFCKANDLLLLCISAKGPDTIEDPGNNWQRINAVTRGNLILHVYWRFYESNMPDTEITVSPDASIAAVMAAIEHVDPGSPIDWQGVDAGKAWWYDPSTHPTPLQSSGFEPNQLNVQIFAADRFPWYAGTLGLASFVDVAIATAMPNDLPNSSSVAIAVRSGPMPTLNKTPRVLQLQTGHWAQVGLRLEAAP